jgi:protein serine kinase H
MPVCAESTLTKDSAYVMSDEQQLRNGGDRMPGNLDQRLLHKYEVIAIIGKGFRMIDFALNIHRYSISGSFSRVLRVEHRQSRQPYAVKLVPAKNGTGPFENELAILNRLSHPFVIRLEEIFRSQTRVYIVMEMASGGELYDRIVAKGLCIHITILNGTLLFASRTIFGR